MRLPLILLVAFLARPDIALAECGTLAAAITATMRAVDGDTLVVVGTKRSVRLFGIDAPELRDGAASRLALAARNSLDAAVTGSMVECRTVEWDRYCRTVAVCTAAGADLAELLLERGHAWTMRQYLHGPKRDEALTVRYERAESAARQKQRGVWER